MNKNRTSVSRDADPSLKALLYHYLAHCMRPSVSRDADPSLKGFSGAEAAEFVTASVSRDADPSLKDGGKSWTACITHYLRSVEMLTLH